MNEHRIHERIQWVYENLKTSWIGSIQRTEGMMAMPHLDVADVLASPYQKAHGYQYSVWENLGPELAWERAELSVHTTAPITIPSGFREWVTVREFQRDITTWVKVWRDVRFQSFVNQTARPITLSQILTHLVQGLHALGGSVDVMVTDPDDRLIAVWIRLKSYPEGGYVCASIPKHSSLELSHS